MLIDALTLSADWNEIICVVSNLFKNHINNPYLYDTLLNPSTWKDIPWNVHNAINRE